MKTSKLIFIGKILAASIIILGIIHEVATFTPLVRSGLMCLEPAKLDSVIFMSLMSGASFIVSGLILVVLFPKVEQFTFLITPIIIIGIFLAVSGVLSVLYMSNNLFAWITLFLKLCILAVTVGLRIKLEIV